jgi:hypothetical protein
MTIRDLANKFPASDDLLCALGLETRRSTTESMLSAVAIFGAGLTVGVALALLFAPKSGEETRADLGERVSRMRDEFSARREASATNA